MGRRLFHMTQTALKQHYVVHWDKPKVDIVPLELEGGLAPSISKGIIYPLVNWYLSTLIGFYYKLKISTYFPIYTCCNYISPQSISWLFLIRCSVIQQGRFLGIQAPLHVQHCMVFHDVQWSIIQQISLKKNSHFMMQWGTHQFI